MTMLIVMMMMVLCVGEHLGEEYGKINPFHLVPAIDDNGFLLTESVAILKYLADKHQVADHWYPKDLQQRARVDSYMAWQHLNLRIHGAMVFRVQVIDTKMSGKPVDKEKLARFESDLETTLDKVERIYLKNDPYLCGTNISVADLLGICELMQPVIVGHDVFKGRPKLEDWARRVKQKVGRELFDESHSQVYRLKELLAAGQSKL